MKKFLSVLLAVLMLAVMLPVVAMAEENVVEVTPGNAASTAFNETSNVTFKFAAGDYGAFKAVVGANTNVTFKGGNGANFSSFEVTYKVNRYNETDKSASTMTVEGLNVTGTITINSADGTLIVKDNTAAKISVTMNRQDGKENANIQISNNILTGGDYGVFLVPNHSGYKLTISGNEFNNIKKHAIAIMGNQSDIPATPETMTAADTISVTQNKFNSYGVDDGSNRAAFKIWNDTKLAPEGSEVANDAAVALANSIASGNTFSKDLGENCKVALFDRAPLLDPPTPPEEEGPSTIVIITPTEDTPKTDDQKNPATGANDMVAAAAALMAVAALGMSILSRKK